MARHFREEQHGLVLAEEVLHSFSVADNAEAQGVKRVFDVESAIPPWGPGTASSQNV
jgi:hypothetical protein